MNTEQTMTSDLTASAFNWTPAVVEAERAADDIAVGIVAGGTATTIELELGQTLRSYPAPDDDETGGLRRRLADAGGCVSIVGISIDDWRDGRSRRDDDERYAFLVPQFRAAHKLGARGVRLPIGQPGPRLLPRIQHLAHKFGLEYYEEIQGQQAPQTDDIARAIDSIADLDDPRVRVLVDISMLMPALPTSYLQLLERSAIPAPLVRRLRDDWRSPETHTAVIDLLRAGGVPPAVHTAYMNLLIRFGRSSVEDIRAILPLVGAFHLKFWDLDDADGRVSSPIRALGTVLRGSRFSGTLCSEWGGHEWLDDDPTTMTQRHLALARSALAA